MEARLRLQKCKGSGFALSPEHSLRQAADVFALVRNAAALGRVCSLSTLPGSRLGSPQLFQLAHHGHMIL